MDPNDEHFTPSMKRLGEFLINVAKEKRRTFAEWLRSKQEDDLVIKWVKAALTDRDQRYQFDDPKQVRNTVKRAYSDLERRTKQLNFAASLKKYLKANKIFVDANGCVRLKSKQGPYVIPMDERTHCIQAVHHAPGTFHLGCSRTAAVVRQYFYWNNVDADVKAYVTSCDQCIRGKRLKPRSGPGMQRTSSVPQRRLTVWSADVIEMPLGYGKKKYIVTFQDVATGWLEAFAVTSASGKVIAGVIRNRMAPTYGEGLTYTTDQGKEFTAKVVKEAIRDTGAQHYLTTSYHSQSNPVERVHRDMNAQLRMILDDKSKDISQWPLYLAPALMTLRMSPDSLTGDSPYLRAFGQKPCTRIDVMLGNEEVMAPWAPAEPQEEKFKKIDESEDKEVWQRELSDGRKVTRHFMKKIPRDPASPVHLLAVATDVNAITVQEEAMERKNIAAAKRHLKNREHFNQTQQPKYYLPLIGEICDWNGPHDQNAGMARKTAIYWHGPYRVMGYYLDYNEQSVYIRRLDPKTLDFIPGREGRQRRVYAGDLRPSTNLLRDQRPHGEFEPAWNVCRFADDRVVFTDAPKEKEEATNEEARSEEASNEREEEGAPELRKEEEDAESDDSFELVDEEDAHEEPRVTRQQTKKTAE